MQELDCDNLVIKEKVIEYLQIYGKTTVAGIPIVLISVAPINNNYVSLEKGFKFIIELEGLRKELIWRDGQKLCVCRI